MRKLDEKQISIAEKVKVTTENSKSLADRSASALQSSKDILPTITQAEFDYFQELKRLKQRAANWKDEVDRLYASSQRLSKANGTLSLPTDHLKNSSQLLSAIGVILEKYKRKMDAFQIDIESVANACFVRSHN
jgi:membrane-associated HD superfamily phosphohydrolase